MSTENVERIRQGFEAMARGDVETVVALADPEIQFVNPEYAIEGGTRFGLGGYRTALQNTLDAFDVLRFEIDEIVEAGDKVVVLGTWSARGKGSGVSLDGLHFGHVFTLRDDKLIRHEWFLDRAEALRAAGLDERAAAQLERGP